MEDYHLVKVPCTFCSYHNKPLDMVTEYEEECCAEHGFSCEDCPYFTEEGEVILD